MTFDKALCPIKDVCRRKGEYMKQQEYQESLDYFLNRDEGDNLTVTCDWLSNAEELKELVDKETPMKPITLESCHYECRKCHSTILPIGHKRTWHKQFNKYCHNCGQRIDWSDGDE